MARVTADAFVEMRVWRVPQPVPGSGHDLKYALAYVVAGTCVQSGQRAPGHILTKGERERHDVHSALHWSTSLRKSSAASPGGEAVSHLDRVQVPVVALAGLIAVPDYAAGLVMRSG